MGTGRSGSSTWRLRCMEAVEVGFGLDDPMGTRAILATTAISAIRLRSALRRGTPETSFVLLFSLSSTATVGPPTSAASTNIASCRLLTLHPTPVHACRMRSSIEKRMMEAGVANI
jgi:hypothetical protein